MIIFKESTLPWLTAVTLVNCVSNSSDSIIKSLSANLSDNLYGKVFLTKFELLKSNDCDSVDSVSKVSGSDL